jgi:hypothetical protein
MRFKATGWMALMAVVLAGGAQAHGPEGSGDLALSATWFPMTNTNLADLNGQAYQLSADAPVVNGLGLKADLGLADLRDHQVITGFDDTFVDARLYNFDLFVNLYPAGFAGRGFTPGVDANPDGWLGWPGLGVGYTWNRVNQFRSGTVSFGGPVTNETELDFETDQAMDYQLTLPVAAWLSAGGSFQRALSSDYGRSNSAATASTYGATEGEGAWVNAYINLVGGAGADQSRPFLPHFGRLGQMMIGVAWQRTVSINPYLTDFSNDYSLMLGAPVTSCLSVLLGGDQSNSSYGSTPIRGYHAMLTYAFGDAQGRP